MLTNTSVNDQACAINLCCVVRRATLVEKKKKNMASKPLSKFQ